MATPITSVTCMSLTRIDGTDCIGDSRQIINDNTLEIGTTLCDIAENTIYPVTSDTIIHDFDTIGRTLSSEIRNNSITSDMLTDDSVTTAKLSAQAVTTDKIAPDTVRYSQLASWQTLSASPTLSAEAVQPRLAKAWVNFDGAVTVPTISSAFNVSSITDIGTGQYQINFITPMNNTAYCVNITGTYPSALGAINACAIGFESQTSTAGQIKYKTVNGIEISFSDNGANQYLDVFTGNVLIFSL